MSKRPKKSTSSDDFKLRARSKTKSSSFDGYIPKKLAPRPSLSESQKNELYKAFGYFDSRGTGIVPGGLLRVVLRSMTLEDFEGDIYHMLATSNGREISDLQDVQIDYKDYYHLMETVMLGDDRPGDVRRAFDLFSNPDTLRVDFNHLKGIATELQSDVSDDELKEMIKCADTDHVGAVDWRHFQAIMHRPELE